MSTKKNSNKRKGSRNRPATTDLKLFFSTLVGESDRGRVLVGLAQIDLKLVDVISYLLVHVSLTSSAI
jgi:hypothetical protein